MRVSRTDLVPVVTIVAGGALGVLLTFSPLALRSPADDVPAAVRYVPVHDVQSRVFVSHTGHVYRFHSVDPRPALSPDGQWIPYRAQPLIYMDGVPVGTSFPESLDPDNVVSIEAVKGDAAVELYGEEAHAGVYRITLRESRHRR